MAKRKRERSLRKSMRERKRYLKLGKCNKERVKKAIMDYIGILGFGKASPQFVKNKDNVLSINRKELDKVKAALEMADIEVIRVSGSLKGL
jgi:RNase P/RNase MRP subunit POP5